MVDKKLLGLKSKQKGRASEKLFADMCEIQGIHYVRIEDGGFVNKKKIFIRKKQICDFIFFLNSQPYFVDIKSYHPDTVVFSTFFSSGKNSNSTQRQVKNFIDISKKGKFNRLGFIFLPESQKIQNIKNQPFYYLPAHSLESIKHYKATNRSDVLRRRLIKLNKIRDIDLPQPF